MKTPIFGVNFDSVTPDEAVSFAFDILNSENSPGCRYVVTPNPEIVSNARRDIGFRDILNGAALVLADGIGVIYASRILKTPIPQRVTGIEFAQRILRLCAGSGTRVFLLGAAPGVAEKAAENLISHYPGLKIAGTHDGYFKDEPSVIREIHESGAALLLVCLGSPKQEEFMARNAGGLGCKLAVGLGGALDVWSGNVKRAPKLMQKLGFEWLYRLIREPRRIGRMIKLPLFLAAAVNERKKPEKAA